MIEYILLALSWYAIGLFSMLLVQRWWDKSLLEERKVFPTTTPYGEIGSQEVWVLGICGPLVTCFLLYIWIVAWWLTRNEKT